MRCLKSAISACSRASVANRAPCFHVRPLPEITATQRSRLSDPKTGSVVLSGPHVCRLQLPPSRAALLADNPTEVDGLVQSYVLEEGNNALSGWVAPAKSRFNTRYNSAVAGGDKAAQDQLDLFRKDLGSFVRAYDFLSQIVDFADTDLEKRSIYYKHLLPVLRVNEAKVALDLSGVVLAKYALKDKGRAQLQLSGEGELLKP